MNPAKLLTPSQIQATQKRVRAAGGDFTFAEDVDQIEACQERGFRLLTVGAAGEERPVATRHGNAMLVRGVPESAEGQTPWQ